MQAGFVIEYDSETDGRWIADVPDFPGVLAYGATKDEAEKNVNSLLQAVLREKSDSNRNT
jgi:predicted RNase H-like HicB family nuclease